MTREDKIEFIAYVTADLTGIVNTEKLIEELRKLSDKELDYKYNALYEVWNE